MHAKFYVFTETGTAKDVVMVSSSNLNKGGAVKGWNDLYVMKGRPDIVADYAAVHAEMAEDTARDGDQYREFVRGEYTSRFFPRPGGGDATYEDLSNIRCQGATEGSGVNGRTAINITAGTDLRSVDEFRSMVIKSGEGGQVRLSDVATVELGGENYETAVASSGRQAVFIAITPTPDGNPLEIVKDIENSWKNEITDPSGKPLFAAM